MPVSDDDLIIIGRITLIWSQIDVSIDRIIMLICRFDYDQYSHLFRNKTLTPKIEALKVFSNEHKHKDKIDEMIVAVSACVANRNLITHGIWGWEHKSKTNSFRACAHSINRGSTFYASDLYDFHERVHAASVKVDEAFCLLMMNKQAPNSRNRPSVFADSAPTPNSPAPPNMFKR